MEFKPAQVSDFEAIRNFYWDVIDDIHLHNVNNENLGWEKGVYPLGDYIRDSLAAGELYTRCGFRFVEAKNMFYEDTGWTEFKLFELNL